MSSALLAAVTPDSTSTSTQFAVTGWVSEPSTRGTWSLLYSCFFTIGLCIWTAIHTDIPSAQHSRWRVFLYKLAWVGIAFTLPELVLVVASSQLCRAWRLRKKLQKIAQKHRVAIQSSQKEVPPAMVSPKADDDSKASAVELALGATSKKAGTESTAPVEPKKPSVDVANRSEATGAAVKLMLEVEQALPVNTMRGSNLSQQNNDQGIDKAESNEEIMEEETRVSVRHDRQPVSTCLMRYVND